MRVPVVAIVSFGAALHGLKRKQCCKIFIVKERPVSSSIQLHSLRFQRCIVPVRLSMPIQLSCQALLLHSLVSEAALL